MTLQVMPAPYQLPAAVSREVLLPASGGLLIIGGLTPFGTSASTVTSLDPVTGGTRPAGRLAQATHDAAGLVLGGRAFVLGGGTASSVPTVQAFTPGTPATVTGAMSRARSDSGGVSAGPAGYVIGGYDGTRLDPEVLATRDGLHFRVAARLPVPVRYAAMAAADGLIWVFGGQTAAGPTDVIQRIDPATGAATVAGHLPRPVQGAAALSLGGQVYVAGGAGTGDVLRFDPVTSRVSAAGQLPVPVGYAAAAVTGGIGYLVGGEDNGRPVPAVTMLPAGARRDPEGGARSVAGGGRGARAAGAGLGSVGVARRRPYRRPPQQPAADRRPVRPDQVGVPAARRPRARSDVPAAGRRVLLPDGTSIIATQEDDQVISVISVATSRITYRYGVPADAGLGARPPVQPGRRHAHPGRRHRLGRHQELPPGDHHAAGAYHDPGHRADDERVPARPAAAVRQPERRFPDDQRALPGHRDQRRLGRRDVNGRTGLVVGEPGQLCTRRTATRYTPAGI